MPESKKFATVDDYAASLPDATKERFAELRALVADAAPGSTEGISYNIAARKDAGFFVYFAGAKKHVSLHPAPTGEPEFERDIAPYHSGKGTLQFALDKPLPADLIVRVVQFRRQQLADANAAKAAKSKKANKTSNASATRA